MDEDGLKHDPENGPVGKISGGTDSCRKKGTK